MVPPRIDRKNCLTCEKTLRGRSDKKFCDDYCRNQYNNSLKAAENGTIRSINNTLARNRRILQSLLPAGKETTRISREQLLVSGLSFKYFTHCFTARTGHHYHFCYDHGYRRLENDWYMIVRNKED